MASFFPRGLHFRNAQCLFCLTAVLVIRLGLNMVEAGQKCCVIMLEWSLRLISNCFVFDSYQSQLQQFKKLIFSQQIQCKDYNQKNNQQDHRPTLLLVVTLHMGTVVYFQFQINCHAAINAYCALKVYKSAAIKCTILLFE